MFRALLAHPLEVFHKWHTNSNWYIACVVCEAPPEDQQRLVDWYRSYGATTPCAPRP
jgi:hypothetical protein